MSGGGAARRPADIIAFTGAAAARNGGPLQMPDSPEPTERVAYVRELRGPRLDRVR
ncbi:hypothetical protein [Nocardia amamiensis]|uniref:hypothetical protein n=1 Tax=Nocardia amamiensis TaxID=404578 RepID=UPI0012F487BF|nr:hypothetical protein [Nocardia amamiensis]